MDTVPGLVREAPPGRPRRHNGDDDERDRAEGCRGQAGKSEHGDGRGSGIDLACDAPRSYRTDGMDEHQHDECAAGPTVPARETVGADPAFEYGRARHQSDHNGHDVAGQEPRDMG